MNTQQIKQHEKHETIKLTIVYRGLSLALSVGSALPAELRSKRPIVGNLRRAHLRIVQAV